MLLLCVDGKVESLWEGKKQLSLIVNELFIGIVSFFSWAEPDQRLHRFEFHYFLDSLFRGLLGLVVIKGEKLPLKRGYMVNSEQIEKVVYQVYGDNEFLDKENLAKGFENDKELIQLFGFFCQNLHYAVKLQKIRSMERF